MSTRIDRFVGGLTADETEACFALCVLNLPVDRIGAVLLASLGAADREELAAILHEEDGGP
jgi:hypothetical protein